MFKTTIEFMDGIEREYPSRHMARVDGQVFRMIFDHEEVVFPLVNIRRIIKTVIPDGK